MNCNLVQRPEIFFLVQKDFFSCLNFLSCWTGANLVEIKLISH